MCGLLGLLAPGTHPDLRQALSQLAHRGPDDEGCFGDLDFWLGARRLSIIDVAGGHQPLANESATVWAAQNGEIYNYQALRAELEALGHVFRTRSDTEVIVHAYEAWGEAAVQRLRGIFALAVWDTRQRRLLLARDRFGVKPLYYVALPGGGLAFASEIRPLLEHLPRGPRADLAALKALFAVGFIPTPRTAFAEVRKLPAAHWLVAEGGRLRLDRYWDLPAPSEPSDRRLRFDEAAAQLRHHLQRAVREQRMSEVPLGALISGGLDSAAIAALLQAESREPVHTFNIGFDHPAYDETPHAALAARHLGTQHHQVRLSEADFERYPAVLARLEEPQCSATALPIFHLYQACREAGLTVILTGEGADELLGGYHWYRGDALAQPLLRLPQPVRALAAAGLLPMSPAAKRVLRAGANDLAARYVLWQGIGSACAELCPEVRAQGDVIVDWRALLDPAAVGRDPFRQLQYLEAHTRLVDFINFEVDRMSMAHSIEARVPFLDHELWEFAARLPTRLLAREPKALLRHALQRDLPAATLARRKQGLAAPYAAWLRRARWPEWAEALVTPGALRASGYFEPAVVQRLRAEHQAGRCDHSRRLIGVLSTQLWQQTFAVGRD